MPRRWKLLDTSDGTVVSRQTLDAAALGIPNASVARQTLQGGLADGVDVVRVDNGKFKFDILPTRGMGLWKAWLGDFELGWQSPNRGPVHPKFVAVGEASGLGWLDGFDELLVRCGLESNGAPEFDADGRVRYPLHGRIANKPAHLVEVSADDGSGEIRVAGVVEETRFHFLRLQMTSEYITKSGAHSLTIRDTIENMGGRPTPIQMLYHVNFGLPLLDAGSQVVAPVKAVVPRNDHAAASIKGWNSYLAEEPGFEEQVYFFELKQPGEQTQVLLKNAHSSRGASLKFDKRKLPCFTLWKDTGARQDGYVTGLEPGTNFPNPRSFEGEQGRVATLKPGQKIVYELTLTANGDAASVAATEKDIAALSAGAAPEVFSKPQKGWCAGV